MKRGLLLIDRGSRAREASEELEAICAAIQSRADYAFADYCFLEVEPPYIEDGIRRCLKNGIDALTIVPFFLYPGKKVKNAVTDAMKFQKGTSVKFVVTKPMSMHRALVDLVDSRIRAALEENGVGLPKSGVDVLIIGHGSVDPNAQMSMNFVVDGLRKDYRNVDRCWLEIEQPDIPAGVSASAKNGPRALVIVFYFLHEGIHVKTDINNELLPALERSGLDNVFVTRHLGADERIIDLILERAAEVEGAD